MRDDGTQMVIQLPRFSRGMKILSIYAVVVWLVLVFYARVPHAGGLLGPLHWLALVGSRVVPHFELWRLVTYPLIADPTGFGPLWAVLSFWWFGSPIEFQSGLRRVIPLALSGVVGGAVLAFLGSRVFADMLNEPVVGLGPVADSFLVGWGFVNASQPVTFFGLGKPMPGKHFAMIFAGIALVMALISRSAMSLASVGGFAGAFVYMWVVTRRAGGSGRKDREQGPRRRRPSGERFKVVQGGRGDKHQWN